MRDLLTRACDAPVCQDVTITADLVDPAGAVLAGRRNAEQVDHWNDDHHGVPIFVPGDRPQDPTVAGYPWVTYALDGTESTIAQAKAAAGERDVMIQAVSLRG
jgi:hypothetical protein